MCISAEETTWTLQMMWFLVLNDSKMGTLLLNMFSETRRRSWFSLKCAYNLIIHKRKMHLRRPELSHTFLLFDSGLSDGSRRSCRQLACCVECVFGLGWLPSGQGRLGEQRSSWVLLASPAWVNLKDTQSPSAALHNPQEAAKWGDGADS